MPTGAGAGFGVSGHATGAFVIKGEAVSWVPAVDVNRLMLGLNQRATTKRGAAS